MSANKNIKNTNTNNRSSSPSALFSLPSVTPSPGPSSTFAAGHAATHAAGPAAAASARNLAELFDRTQDPPSRELARLTVTNDGPVAAAGTARPTPIPPGPAVHVRPPSLDPPQARSPGQNTWSQPQAPPLPPTLTMRERAFVEGGQRLAAMSESEGAGWGEKTTEEVEENAKKEREEHRAKGEAIAPGWEHEEGDDANEKGGGEQGRVALEHIDGEDGGDAAVAAAAAARASGANAEHEQEITRSIPNYVILAGRAEEWRAAYRQRDRDAEQGVVRDCCLLGERAWWCSCWMYGFD
ncbi:uncharacterized protein AB675_7573 [Cyphellophora attinorum]|uniref:Uncharacterized protein n=1 Tax=Cyphellophora attinorum TaxID=1664694 RepID=A0A0N1H4L7_9EURO|nr:uncharacterized protein AB675_7573 [Phialophora attinorum]KPI40322.1 hypothetical protein AB675_7573 [Phialophora attinorum]